MVPTRTHKGPPWDPHASHVGPMWAFSAGYPLALKPYLEQKIQKLLDQGIIEPSESNYASATWIVNKKTGSEWRKEVAFSHGL